MSAKRMRPALDASARVNAERDRRICAGFTFRAALIQSDPASLSNIDGAVTMAVAAMAGGGGASGDYRWHGGSQDFAWITEDNQTLLLDAPGVVQMGQTALQHKNRLYRIARRLKDRLSVGADIDLQADGSWSE